MFSTLRQLRHIQIPLQVCCHQMIDSYLSSLHVAISVKILLVHLPHFRLRTSPLPQAPYLSFSVSLSAPLCRLSSFECGPCLALPLGGSCPVLSRGLSPHFLSPQRLCVSPPLQIPCLLPSVGFMSALCGLCPVAHVQAVSHLVEVFRLSSPAAICLPPSAAPHACVHLQAFPIRVSLIEAPLLFCSSMPDLSADPCLHNLTFNAGSREIG
jgi:hypothetical protein